MGSPSCSQVTMDLMHLIRPAGSCGDLNMNSLRLMAAVRAFLSMPFSISPEQVSCTSFHSSSSLPSLTFLNCI